MDSLKEIHQKSAWEEPLGRPYLFYCPQCRSERKVSIHPRVFTPRNFFRVAVATAFVMLLTWKWFSWRGIVAFVPLWTLFELVYRTRVRSVLPCDHCGFDPFLYLADVKSARQKMDEFWRQKFSEKGIPFPAPPPKEGQSPSASSRSRS